MGKAKFEKIIFKKNTTKRVRWSDIKHLDFQDDDIIDIDYCEEDVDCDYFILKIIRLVEETDEEYEKRIKQQQISSEHLKKLRYKDYLKLKKEFEPEN